MTDYPNLQTLMRIRAKSRMDCAHAIGLNRTTFARRLRGAGDWKLQECLALRAYLRATKLPLEVVFRRSDCGQAAEEA